MTTPQAAGPWTEGGTAALDHSVIDVHVNVHMHVYAGEAAAN